MGVLEIDHTPVDVIVVDVNDLVIGRPTLTIAIDRRTRMIVGFVLHWEGESYAAIMMALRHAIKPKGYVKQAFGGAIVNEWPCWGLPSVIVIDNGRANHSANLDAACASLGNIGIDYTESRRPQHKAKVERLFATLNKYLFHELPGVSLKRAPDSDYEPSKSARIQLQALNEALHRIIVDFYNVKFHSGLKDIPLEVWRSGVAKTKLRSPSHVRDLDVLSSGSETRKLGVKGINIFGLRYNSLELEYLRVENKGDRDVVVRYDPTDITSIQIHDPVRERYLTVPCLEKEAHGLSVWRWNALRNSRVEKRKRNDRSGIWESRRATTDKLIAEAKKHGNRSKGKRNAVRHHEPATTPDELARRDPVDLLQRPPSDRPRAKKRGTTSVDYRSIPELPTSMEKPVGVISNLPNFDNREFPSAIESEKTALSATFDDASDEAKSARASTQLGSAPTVEGSDAEFEAFLAKKLFVVRR
jgi:putative transposase